MIRAQLLTHLGNCSNLSRNLSYTVLYSATNRQFSCKIKVCKHCLILYGIRPSSFFFVNCRMSFLLLSRSKKNPLNAPLIVVVVVVVFLSWKTRNSGSVAKRRIQGMNWPFSPRKSNISLKLQQFMRQNTLWTKSKVATCIQQGSVRAIFCKPHLTTESTRLMIAECTCIWKTLENI